MARQRHGQEACDTVGSACARGLAGGECRDTKLCIVTGARAWPLGVVSRYSLCIGTGGRSGYRGVSRYKRLYRDRRRFGCWVVSRDRPRHSRAGAATWSGKRATLLRHGRCWACDTAPCTPRRSHDTTGLGTMRAACARRLGQGVHLVHPTQF